MIAVLNQPAEQANAFGAPFREGDVLRTGFGSSSHVNPDFGEIDTITPDGVATLADMAFDGDGNLLIAAEEAVVKVSPQGSFLGEVFSTDNAYTLAIDGAGDIYVPDDDGSIRKFSSTGTPFDDYTVALGGGDETVSSLVVADDDCTIIYANGDAVIHRYDACMESQLGNFGSGYNYAYIVRLTLAGDILAGDMDVIRRLDRSSGSLIETYGTPSSGVVWTGSSANPDGETFLAINNDDELIHRFDISTTDEDDIGSFPIGEGGSGDDLIVFRGLMCSQKPR